MALFGLSVPAPEQRRSVVKVALLSAGVIHKKGFARNFCLARGLAKLGADITLLICNDALRWQRLEQDDVKIVAFPKVLSYRLAKGGLDPLDTITRMTYLARKPFDIIHADVGFRPAAGLPGHLFARLRKVPYVCDWWDWVGYGGMLDRRSIAYRKTLGALDNFFEIWDKQHADGIVTISTCLQERAVALGIKRERTCIIHGGADISNRKAVTRAEAKHHFGFSADRFLVGFSGMGPHEWRNLEPFLEALPALRARIPGFGWFSTGDPLPEHVRQQFGVGAEYRDLGWVSYDDYWWALAAGDVLLLTLRDTGSSRARWPNKMGDYLAAGRAIVTNRVGELAAFAHQYPEGVRLVQWDPADVAAALTELAQNPQHLDIMGARNLQVASTTYTWDHKAAELHAFYMRIREAKKQERRGLSRRAENQQ